MEKDSITFSETADLKYILEILENRKYKKIINVERREGMLDGFITINILRPMHINNCYVCNKLITRSVGNCYTTINNKPIYLHARCWRQIKPVLKYDDKKGTYIK